MDGGGPRHAGGKSGAGDRAGRRYFEGRSGLTPGGNGTESCPGISNRFRTTKVGVPVMRVKLAVATLALLSLPIGSAMADGFLRDVLSSGATTGSTYLTFRHHKLIVAAQDDAGSFVASNGD